MIRSAAEYLGYVKKRDKILFRWLQTGLEMALTEIISLIREWCPVQTGNLQASVGVNRRVAASTSSLGLAQTPLAQLVKRALKRFVALLPIGMSYAKDVDDRTGFATDVINSPGPKYSIKRRVDQAMSQASAEMGG